MKQSFKIIVLFVIVCGFSAPSKAMKPSEPMQDVVAFVKELLASWGYPNIGVYPDERDWPSWTGKNNIYLGKDCLTLANNPEAVKAIVGHELAHIIHNDTPRRLIIGTLLYTIYRATSAFYFQQAGKDLINTLCKPDDWSDDTASKVLTVISGIIIPYITLMRSSAKIFPNADAPFSIVSSPWLTMAFTVIYIYLIGQETRAYETFIDHIIATGEHIVHFLGTTLQTVFSFGVKFITPIIMYYLLRFISLYLQRAFLRGNEYNADLESAYRFNAKEGMITFLNFLKNKFPEQNEPDWTSGHPTPDQRIAAIEAAFDN